MTLLTNQRYRQLTGDYRTPEDEVTLGLTTAQREVEEWLRRPLESLERTEDLIVYSNGRVYPKATPVTIVPSGYQIRGNGVVAGPGSGLPWPLDTTEAPRLSLTYTGGWTQSTLPRELERAIAETALADLQGPLSEVPVGAKAVSLGDASITFEGSAERAVIPAHVQRRIRRWRRARMAPSGGWVSV